jgi:hypothetical protein
MAGSSTTNRVLPPPDVLHVVQQLVHGVADEPDLRARIGVGVRDPWRDLVIFTIEPKGRHFRRRSSDASQRTQRDGDDDDRAQRRHHDRKRCQGRDDRGLTCDCLVRLTQRHTGDEAFAVLGRAALLRYEPRPSR